MKMEEQTHTRIRNPYLADLEKIEFVITYACTGKCKHCSQGDHPRQGLSINAEIASRMVREVAERASIRTLMTFGGEPLLYPETVCAIQRVGLEMGIPKRQLITNGFFSKSRETIKDVARRLAESGINDLLLSVDAFHQETVPLETVLLFARAALEYKIPLRTQPAWLVSDTDDNPYNRETRRILAIFAEMGIGENNGNVIFPSGNAARYLGDYFDSSREICDPYEEDPKRIRTLSVEPTGDVLDGNLYRQSIVDIMESYGDQLL